MPDLFIQLRWQDLLDVILVACGSYWIIHFIRGTRAVQMLVGLVVLFLAYFGSQLFELYNPQLGSQQFYQLHSACHRRAVPA